MRQLCIENPCPLSSDAFSRFGVNAQGNNHEVMEATKMLHQVVIPQFAQWLDQQDEKYIKTVLWPVCCCADAKRLLIETYSDIR